VDGRTSESIHQSQRERCGSKAISRAPPICGLRCIIGSIDADRVDRRDQGALHATCNEILQAGGMPKCPGCRSTETSP
jgi:hypothetical protein